MRFARSLIPRMPKCPSAIPGQRAGSNPQPLSVTRKTGLPSSSPPAIRISVARPWRMALETASLTMHSVAWSVLSDILRRGTRQSIESLAVSS